MSGCNKADFDLTRLVIQICQLAFFGFSMDIEFRFEGSEDRLFISSIRIRDQHSCGNFAVIAPIDILNVNSA